MSLLCSLFGDCQAVSNHQFNWNVLVLIVAIFVTAGACSAQESSENASQVLDRIASSYPSNESVQKTVEIVKETLATTREKFPAEDYAIVDQSVTSDLEQLEKRVLNAATQEYREAHLSVQLLNIGQSLFMLGSKGFPSAEQREKSAQQHARIVSRLDSVSGFNAHLQAMVVQQIKHQSQRALDNALDSNYGQPLADAEFEKLTAMLDEVLEEAKKINASMSPDSVAVEDFEKLNALSPRLSSLFSFYHPHQGRGLSSTAAVLQWQLKYGSLATKLHQDSANSRAAETEASMKRFQIASEEAVQAHRSVVQTLPSGSGAMVGEAIIQGNSVPREPTLDERMMKNIIILNAVMFVLLIVAVLTRKFYFAAR